MSDADLKARLYDTLGLSEPVATAAIRIVREYPSPFLSGAPTVTRAMTLHNEPGCRVELHTNPFGERTVMLVVPGNNGRDETFLSYIYSDPLWEATGRYWRAGQGTCTGTEHIPYLEAMGRGITVIGQYIALHPAPETSK